MSSPSGDVGQEGHRCDNDADHSERVRHPLFFWRFLPQFDLMPGRKMVGIAAGKRMIPASRRQRQALAKKVDDFIWKFHFAWRTKTLNAVDMMIPHPRLRRPDGHAEVPRQDRRSRGAASRGDPGPWPCPRHRRRHVNNPQPFFTTSCTLRGWPISSADRLPVYAVSARML